MRLAVALLVAAAVAVAGATAATKPTKPSNRITALRVCGTNAIPFSGSQCASDRRKQRLVDDELDCSVRLVVRVPATFHAIFFYGGRVQYAYTEREGRGVHKRVIGVYMHNTAMPGGIYSCRFLLGKVKTAVSFRSAGPVGKILGPAACLASHSVNIDECPQDEAGSPFPPTNAVTCSAVFPNALGKSLKVDLTQAGAVVASKTTGLSYPITEAGETFREPGNYAPGDYTCVFVLAGEQVAEKAFKIG